MSYAVLPLSLLAARGWRLLGLLGLALAVLTRPVAAQDDTVAAGDTVVPGTVGPPPHFAAAWAPTGTLVDVSQTAALQRRVSVDLREVSLDAALLTILQQAHLYLAYRNELLPAGRLVSLRGQGLPVAAALAVVLRETGLDVLMSRGGTFALGPCPHQPAGGGAAGEAAVVGRVLDQATGQPLAGAVVSVAGTFLTSTVTATGQYRLVGVPAGPHTVEARQIGYAPGRAPVVVGAGEVVQDFALTPAAQPLEQVVVTGPLVPTPVKALPTPITVITAEDIRQQHVMRLDQLFRGQGAGSLAWDRAASDYYYSLNVRGTSTLSTAASVKTFVDGIEVANPEFAVLFDPASIERIELTRGPQASTMYGPDALGGVLQIFTKKGEFGLARPDGEVTATASLIEKNDGPGVAPRVETGVTLRGGEGQTRYHVAGYVRRDGEWTPSYRNTNWSVTASAENIQGPLTSRITAIFVRKLFDFPWYTDLRDSGYVRFSQPPHETIELQGQAYGVNFVYTPAPWWRHELVLGYDRWAFGLTQTQPQLTTPADTLLEVIMNHRGKLSLFYFTTMHATLARALDATLTAGVNHYRLDGSDALTPATSVNEGTLDGPVTLKRLSASNSGYFAQAQVALAETAFLTAGVRADESLGFGDHGGMLIAPRVGATYVRSLGPVGVKVRASYGESSRSIEPALNQPVVDVGFERRRNPDLRPERQRGSDGGVDLSWRSRASLSVTYYSQDAVDLIDQVFGDIVGDPPRQLSRYENIGRIRNRGWEIEAQYRLKWWQMAGTFSTMNSRVRQLASGYSGDYQIGDRPLDVPGHSAGLTVVYSPFAGTMLRGSVTNVGNWVQLNGLALYGVVFGSVPPRPSTRDYWLTYPGFTKFRVGLEQKLGKRLSGTFDVENLTNRRVFETLNLEVPSPRTFVVGLRTSY